MSIRSAGFVLAASAFLGGPASAHAQPTFGKPMAVEAQARVPGDFDLTAPTRDQLFRVQSEQALKNRLRQELATVKNVDFPRDAPPRPDVPAAERTRFTAQVVAPISGQVCYRPLYFEDTRTERFGQYVPCVQPLLSAERFYRDFLLLPVRLCLTPPWTFECDNR